MPNGSPLVGLRNCILGYAYLAHLGGTFNFRLPIFKFQQSQIYIMFVSRSPSVVIKTIKGLRFIPT